MSFTFGFSRTKAFLLVAITCTLGANVCAAGPKLSPACSAYADKAWYDVQEMKAGKCDEVGGMEPGRFSQSIQHHRDWCATATPQAMRFEQNEREGAKLRCSARLLREEVCRQYADRATKMSNAYQISRCTTEHHPTGRFDYRFQQHFNWCMYTANHLDNEPDREDAARTSELYACKQRKAAEAKKSTPSNKFKTPSVQQSADVDESSEEPPLQVSAAADPTVEDGSVLIVDTDEPAPKQRTQVIVIGNRYAEVPAFDEPQDEGSGVGKVVKAGGAAVVVGTAAVATGVVAAKVLDYADDYKGGLNKAASGAAAALKEKLKDRLDGGGINKSASGAVEAMKEKIKDGFQGGGINKSVSGAAEALKEKLKDRVASGGGITKAMSGPKDALKYKLKERVAGGGLGSKAASGFKEKVKSKLTGGGGGVMKGMAKAGGGLLRRLAGR